MPAHRSSTASPRFKRALNVVLSLAALVCAAAYAADPAPDKLDACRACHGRDGISSAADIPNLAGQRRAYLVQQLRAFRDGARKHDLMSVIAGQLGDADIDALAAFWSTAQGGAAPAPAHPATVSPMTLPADFPRGFTEYARENDDESKTFSVSYANTTAVSAARVGKPLPDGSAIVVANYAAKLDAGGKPVIGPDGRWIADKPRSFSGMEARAGWAADVPPLLRNGTWLYGLWAGDGSSRLGANQPRCLACHKAKADQSYVFTLDALRKAR